MRRKTSGTRAVLAGSLLALLLASGCGEQHPQAPRGTNLDVTESTTSLGKKNAGPGISDNTGDTRVARYSLLNMTLMRTEDLSTSQMVKASTGGTLYFGEFKFYIPPGALTRDTVISITATSDKYIQMDFGPDGTQFDPPAVMTISYATANLQNLKASNLSVSWFDTTQNKWINIGGTVDQSTMTVSVPVTHFTQYSLSTK